MSTAIIFKTVIILLIILIGLSLASGLVFLIKDGSESKRLLVSLTFRISLSIILFVALLFGYYAGWIQPHGLGQ